MPEQCQPHLSFSSKSAKGFLLVEVVVAAAILSMLVVVIAQFLTIENTMTRQIELRCLASIELDNMAEMARTLPFDELTREALLELFENELDNGLVSMDCEVAEIALDTGTEKRIELVARWRLFSVDAERSESVTLWRYQP